MKKKNKKNGLFDKRYLLGIPEDLDCTPEELDELKRMLEEYKKEHKAEDTEGDAP